MPQYADNWRLGEYMGSRPYGVSLKFDWALRGVFEFCSVRQDGDMHSVRGSYGNKLAIGRYGKLPDLLADGSFKKLQDMYQQ